MKKREQKNQGEYLNLITDYAFKRVFGRNKRLLMSMLNAFLSDLIGEIKNIVYQPTEQLGFTEKMKKMTFDLYCEDQNKNQIIIEMQQAEQSFYGNRMVCYVGRIVSNSVKRGDPRYQIPNVISFNLINYNAPWFKGKDDVRMVYRLKNEKNEILSEIVAIVLINLYKFATKKASLDKMSAQAHWCHVIRNMGDMKKEDELNETHPVFRELFEECRLSNLNETEMEAYKKSVMEYEDVQDAIIYASRKYLKQGKEKGIAETKRQIAFSMLAMGLPIPTIAEATGLTEEEVLAINNSR